MRREVGEEKGGASRTMQRKNICLRLNTWKRNGLGCTGVSSPVEQYCSDTSLMRASRHGDVVRAEELLDSNVDVNESDQNGVTALHVAFNPAMVDLLLKRGASLEERAGNQWTPLMTATRADRIPVVNSLICKGARIDRVNAQGNTVLMLAAQMGSTEMIALLLSKGGNPNDPNHDYYSATMLAVQNGHSAGAALLLESNMRIPWGTEQTNEPLFALAKASRSPETLKLVVLHGYIEVNASNRHVELGYSIDSKSLPPPLVAAAQCGDLDTARSLLHEYDKTKINNSIYTPDKNGNTALHVASTSEMAELLLAHGFDVNIATHRDLHQMSWMPLGPAVSLHIPAVPWGLTPLMAAARDGRITVVVSLLKHNANLTAVSSNEETAMIFAVKHSHRAVMKLLLEKAKACTWNPMTSIHSTLHQLVCAESSNGRTPVQFAILAGSTKTVELLLSYGAELEWDSYFDSPLALAASVGETDVVRFLLKKDICKQKIDYSDYFSEQTPLIKSAENGFHGVVSLLLAHNARADIPDDEGRTALFHAIKNGHLETVNVLVLHRNKHPNIDIYSNNPGAVTCALDVATKESLMVASLLVAYGEPYPDNNTRYMGVPAEMAVEKGLELKTTALAWYIHKTKQARVNDLDELPNALRSLIAAYDDLGDTDMLFVWREWEQHLLET